MADVPQPFDRARRRALRARSAGQDSFFLRWMAEDLGDRLSAVSRGFTDILLIGPVARYRTLLSLAAEAKITVAALSEREADPGDIVCEEDRLPFEPGSFDLIISAGTLDSVNDLPGAFIQFRRILRPDGLFLGSMFGAGSLSLLKRCMIAADGARTGAHIHPQIDVRSAGDLLARAGFTMPVADGDRLTLRYADPMRLVQDIRESGIGNALSGPRTVPGKAGIARLLDYWNAACEPDGKASEQLDIIALSGWAPSPDQAKPARRGSATVSLADALGSGGKKAE